MLAVHTPNALRRAIASQDVAALTRAPRPGALAGCVTGKARAA